MLFFWRFWPFFRLFWHLAILEAIDKRSACYHSAQTIRNQSNTDSQSLLVTIWEYLENNCRINYYWLLWKRFSIAKKMDCPDIIQTLEILSVLPIIENSIVPPEYWSCILQSGLHCLQVAPEKQGILANDFCKFRQYCLCSIVYCKNHTYLFCFSHKKRLHNISGQI